MNISLSRDSEENNLGQNYSLNLSKNIFKQLFLCFSYSFKKTIRVPWTIGPKHLLLERSHKCHISVDIRFMPVIYKCGLNWGNWTIFHLPRTWVEKKNEKKFFFKWPRVNRCSFSLKNIVLVSQNTCPCGI